MKPSIASQGLEPIHCKPSTNHPLWPETEHSCQTPISAAFIVEYTHRHTRDCSLPLVLSTLSSQACATEIDFCRHHILLVFIDVNDMHIMYTGVQSGTPCGAHGCDMKLNVFQCIPPTLHPIGADLQVLELYISACLFTQPEWPTL